jgi:hypothetical protein
MEASNTMYGRKFTQGSEAKRGPIDYATDGGTPIGVDDVYKELIHLRQNKRGLEKRIKQLEVQNFNITQSGFKQGERNNDSKLEPNKPMFEPEQANAEYTADKILNHN